MPLWIKVMSTFERVRRNILADMEAQTAHTAESWCDIMLRNTARLTDEKEQAKFWGFLTNPNDEEDIPMPKLERWSHDKIAQPETVKLLVKDEDDEKGAEVELENVYERRGQTMYIKTRVKRDQEESTPLLTGLSLSVTPMDEKKEM